MAIRSFKPYTPGTRTRVVTDFSEVTSSKPERSLVVSKHQKKDDIILYGESLGTGIVTEL